MNVLGIETATSGCAVGLLASTGLELTRVMLGERHHNEVLVQGMADLLGQAKLGPQSIDRVVVDHGPGLFTGLRVGIATAIAFAQGVGADLVEVSSLELLAHGARRDGVIGHFDALVDARRGELFVQSFELSDDVTALTSPFITRPEELVASWTEHPLKERYVGGDGAARYAQILAPLAPSVLADLTMPPILEALRLGVTRAPVMTVTPQYLRDADAVVNFATRERP